MLSWNKAQRLRSTTNMLLPSPTQVTVTLEVKSQGCIRCQEFRHELAGMAPDRGRYSWEGWPFNEFVHFHNEKYSDRQT